MKLFDIKPNPNNPRIIKDDKFKKLVKSLKDFPEMMELRPIVVDSEMVTLGGNMRLKALQELGYKDIPDTWVKAANELTDEQKREFIIKDNVGYGEWEWEQLANEWDMEKLTEWGLDIPDVSLVDKNIDFKLKPALHKRGDFYFISLFKAREEIGKSLEEFKKDKNNALQLAYFASDFINSMYQVKDNLVIVTTPKRSHNKKNGFHFASECCREISIHTSILFLEDVFTAKNFNKIGCEITCRKEVKEDNILLIDDIITTGSTIIECRKLLVNKNILVMPLINNN